MISKKVYETSGKIFEQVSIKTQPAMYEQLKAIKPGEIVVVSGVHDHIEKLLPTIKAPFDLIEFGDIASHNGGRVMFVNCATYSSAPKKSVETFVNEGGRLVTTDWAWSFTSHIFPDKLKFAKKTIDDVVEIECNTDIARRLIGLNYSQCHPKWWLEGSSDIYDIGQGVIPLITSEEMKEKYGKPYVAVGFTSGKGEVIHFISHLELQRTQLRSKADVGDLDDFLAKMKAVKSEDMEEAKVAELEAAYSTLNTLAYLCIPMPLLNTSMKSIMVSGGKSAMKSKGLTV